jgi:hypothetical protein
VNGRTSTQSQTTPSGPGATSGCRCRAWAPTTRPTRCRSWCAARARGSTTPTAPSTSTASRDCSPTCSATAAPTSPPRPPSRSTTMAFFPLWTYAHPKAIELAEKVASLAPGRPQPRLLHHRRRRGERERVEAGASVPQDARRHRPLQGHQSRHRLPRHHAGALTITSLEPYRQPFEPLVPGAVKVPAVNFYRAEQYGDDFEAFGSGRPTRSKRPSCAKGPRRRRGLPRAGAERRGLLHAPAGLLAGRCARSATATA